MTPSAVNPAIDVAVESDAWDALEFNAARLADEIIRLAMTNTGKPSGEISLLLTSDDAIQVLNRDFRGKDKPTNVLSFPMEEPGFLGDIAIAFETTQKEAAAMNVPFRDHYTHLLIHGTLHLQGHDHETEEDAAKMETLEIAILARLGIENPYARPNFLA